MLTKEGCLTRRRRLWNAVGEDLEWLLIADLFPEPVMTRAGGRPPTAARPCLEGILWVLRSGARWKDLPSEFPSYVTCWRRFRDWTRGGVWRRAWERLACELDDLGGVDWRVLLADGSFSRAKKGAPPWAWGSQPSMPA